MDQVTVSIAIGLLVSLAVTEAFGMTAGGMIVPGYFALSVHRPLDLALTLLVSLGTYGIVRLLSQHMIIYGRRRIVMALLLGFLLGAMVRVCPGIGSPATDATNACGCVIGFIIPGLIALWFDRQGVRGTLGSLATATAMVRFSLIVVGMGTIS